MSHHTLECMLSGPSSQGHFDHGVKKRVELDLIRSKTKLINGEVWCEYPYIKDPACLPFNRRTVEKVPDKVQRDLIRDGLLTMSRSSHSWREV